MKLAGLLAVLVSAAWAQPAFEAASVKPSAPIPAPPSDGMRVSLRGCSKVDPAIVQCNGATLRTLLIRAYKVQDYEIDGPAWIGTAEFDVMAKVPDGVSADQVPAMLQALLAERFGLKLHRESRLLAGYELNIAKGGPKLQEINASKLPVLEPGKPLGNQPPTEWPAGEIRAQFLPNGGRFVIGNLTIDQLTNHIQAALDRPVANATGLSGTYSIQLSYVQGNEYGPNGDRTVVMYGNLAPKADRGGMAEASTPVPTLLEAVRKLGLKLDPKKVEAEVIVIDSANRAPTEN